MTDPENPSRSCSIPEVADRFAIRLDTEGQGIWRIDASDVASAFQLLALAGEPESTDIATDDWLGLICRLADTSHQHDQPRFIIVDRIPNPDIGFGLFRRMRDGLWEIHYRWATFHPPGRTRPLHHSPIRHLLPHRHPHRRTE